MTKISIFLYIILHRSILTKAYQDLDEFATIGLQGIYGENKTIINIDYKHEYVIRYDDSSSKYPYVIYAWTHQQIEGHPVFVVVRQQNQVTSWELPMTIENKKKVVKFPSTSRTLCHNNMDVIAQLPRNITFNAGSAYSFHKELSVSLSTSSRSPIAVTLRVDEENNFYVTDYEDYTVTVSPTEPRFFYYKFLPEDHENFTNTVILEVFSEDNTCLIVSVQNASCPVYDLDETMTFNGKYQTINYKGGIIVKKREYPNGFFIVFVVKSNTFSCNRESSAIPDFIDRRHPSQKYFSTLTFSIKPGISYEDYMIASFTTLAVILIFYIVFSFSTWAFYRWSNLRKLSYPDSIPLKNRNQSEVPETSIQNADVDDVDTRLDTTNLMLSDLAKKDEEYFEKKSLTYFWHVISIAIFYGIPVVQLVITYQRVVNISGNQDICYYNFLCANPLSGVSDFNHIYSNIGYVLMGILFLIITFYRHRYIVHKDGCGIPKHYGLFYAMGVALIMEGVLSACYHICPNQSNFQFDTSFMYVMAALGIVQLYQKRHPDINATAYATFLVLGLAIFAAMIGILNGHILLWILFIISYVCLCIYITLNIYFLSYVRRGIQTVYNEWSTERNIRKAIEPKRKAHFTVLVIANVINIGLANMGILCYFQGTDFATFLLGLLMGNVVLYAIIYIIMKVIHHEKICIQPALYGILSLITWIGATYFFVNNTSMWTETAAESKQWNQHCALMEFYDYHDIWHLLSAPALFLSFMMLLTLDDDLINTPHKNIVVF